MSDHKFSSLDQFRIRAREALDDVGSLRLRLGAAAVVIAVGVGAWGLTQVASSSAAASPSSYSTSSGKSYATTTTADGPATTTVAPAQSVVDVVGAVKNPGVYKVAAAARVGDVVNAAGGLTDDADLDRINLAAKVTDSQQVVVVRKGEATPAAAATSAGGTDVATPVNINDASVDQLDALPGVGPSTAAAIVQYRTQHGPFKSVADLSKVSGIGPAKLAQIKTRATV